MVADLRTDLRGEIALYQGMGQSLGSGLDNYEQSRQASKKEFNKLYLESATEQLVSVLHESSTYNWPADKTHAAIKAIRGVSQTKAYEKYAFQRQRDSMRQKNNGLMEQYNFWNDDLLSVQDASTFDNIEEDPKVIEVRKQLAYVTDRIKRSWASNAETPVSQEVQQAHIAQPELTGPPSPFTPVGTPRNPQAAQKADAEIEQAIAPPEAAGEQKSPYKEYPDAFQENGVWKVIRDGKKYKVLDD